MHILRMLNYKNITLTAEQVGTCSYLYPLESRRRAYKQEREGVGWKSYNHEANCAFKTTINPPPGGGVVELHIDRCITICHNNYI